MPCPRCKNATYPDAYDKVPVWRKDDPTWKAPETEVKYCQKCGYPHLTPAMRRAIAGNLAKVAHIVALPPGAQLKKIDPKYLGETLDPKRRPKEELDELRKEWEKEWDKNYEEAGNFYDWVGTKKGSATVLQLNAQQREPYAVTIKDGALTGEKIETKYSDYAFVLDSNGNFYAAPKQTSGEERVHHSSFLSGAPVQCAGVFCCIGKAEGHTKKITYVKDYSGHYQPGIPEILRLKKRLGDLGEGKVPLWFYGPPKGKPGALPDGKSPWKGTIETFTGKGNNLTDV